MGTNTLGKVVGKVSGKRYVQQSVERLCERVAIIDQGTLIALGSPQELINQHGGGMVSICLARALPDNLLAELQARADVDTVQQTPSIFFRRALRG